jgi:RNA-directed DNA polymerase
MSVRDAFQRGLAFAMLDGAWDQAALIVRCELALGAKPRWLAGLVKRVRAAFDERPDEANALIRFIDEDDRLREHVPDYRLPGIRKWFFPAPRMITVTGPPADFHVPWIETAGALAAFLAITPSELDWFADTRRLNAARVDPRLRHYHYRWLKKRTQGYRLLETPKPKLKSIQRTIASSLLARIPPSTAAHGFVCERSVLSFVTPHVGQRVVLRLDLEDFFCSIWLARVRAIFRRVGYPYDVAHLLASLCCAPTPSDVTATQPYHADRHALTTILRCAHLPQGAPTSPALSNLVAFKLDRRLAGLARACNARFTRYADDLAFSGDRKFERGLSTFIARAAAIVLEEGFRVRYRKTRVMRAGRRQQLAGLVLNQRINVERSDFDDLRALLYNAARFGPASQNRAQHVDFRAHLAGRIAWVDATNSSRGARLQRLFAQIDWSEEI